MIDPWQAAMQRGDFDAAWRVCDDVLRTRPPQHTGPRHLQRIWNGERVDGQRVFVRCYHGLGDTIMFARLLPLLRHRAREVIVWAQRSLLELLSTVGGIDRLMPLHDGTPELEFDVDVELMELPHVLRLRLDDIPSRVPYLHVHTLPRRVQRMRRVGFVWRSGEWDTSRSLLPDSLTLLMTRSQSVRWYSLQYGASELPSNAIDIACRDLLEQARRVRALDLVITVDTLMAHLAGALGVPVWLLLPTPCDWRWMIDRTDSPWYPTMRLFRQPVSGDWNSVIADVCRALPNAAIIPSSTAP